MKYERKEKVRA